MQFEHARLRRAWVRLVAGECALTQTPLTLSTVYGSMVLWQ